MSIAVTLMERAREFLAKKSTRTAAVAILPLAIAAGSAVATPILIGSYFPGASGGVFGCGYRVDGSLSAVNFWASGAANGAASLSELITANAVNVSTEAATPNIGHVNLDVTWGGVMGVPISRASDIFTMHYSPASTGIVKGYDIGGEPGDLQNQPNLTGIAVVLSVWLNGDASPLGSVTAGVTDVSQSFPAAQLLDLAMEQAVNDHTRQMSWKVELTASWTVDLVDYENDPDYFINNYYMYFDVPGTEHDSTASSPNYVEWTSPQGETVPLPSAAGGALLLMSLLAGFKLTRPQMLK